MKGTAARLLQEADGYKQRVISTAEGDASRFKQVVAEYASTGSDTPTHVSGNNAANLHEYQQSDGRCERTRQSALLTLG